MSNSQITKSDIRNVAVERGFDDVGFARAGFLNDEYERLTVWLENDRHGEMKWMERDPRSRAGTDDWVKTVIVFAKAYPPLLFEPGQKKYAAYAEGHDYHKTLKAMLIPVAEKIRSSGGKAKRFVDTGAILEKAWAQRAGLGFLGRNTMLLSRTHGPYVYLGLIFTDLEFDPDPVGTGTCGDCVRCIEVCPTQALDDQGIDARKCISYLTIELKRPLTDDEKSQLGDWEFGCDDCLTICPYSKEALPAVSAISRGVSRYGK